MVLLWLKLNTPSTNKLPNKNQCYIFCFYVSNIPEVLRCQQDTSDSYPAFRAVMIRRDNVLDWSPAAANQNKESKH